MNRINVDTADDGWFDPDTSILYNEDLRWVDFADEDELEDSEDADERGYYVSAATGTDYSHECLYHTADGRWVLKEWTDQKRAGTYKFISASDAATWIENNEPPKTSPRRGRPEVREPVHVRLSPTLRTQLDRIASTDDLTRAEAMRRLLAAGLTRLAR